MNADIARTLIAGQKIKYWDDRIATVTIPYTPVVKAAGVDMPERFAAPSGGEIAIVFDADIQNPKATHYLYDFDFRLAEPL